MASPTGFNASISCIKENIECLEYRRWLSRDYGQILGGGGEWVRAGQPVLARRGSIEANDRSAEVNDAVHLHTGLRGAAILSQD